MTGDKLGPEKILKVYNPTHNVWGFVVIDSTKRGVAKGGIRMTPTVTEGEVARLARVMTLKTALADIPFGGGKSGIAWNPHGHTTEKKKEIVQWFARAIKPINPSHYIAAPDINMAEEEMRWFVEETANKSTTTGKPKDLGGLPHELGSTGFGVAHAAKYALEFKEIPMKEATVAIEGFGNVGQFAFKFLEEMGARVVAISDSKGMVYNPDGLPFEEMVKIKKETKSVANYKSTKTSEAGIFSLPVDVLIPAALPDVIHEKNADSVKAKIIVEGANIAIMREAESKLHKRGVLTIPDFLANAGGVIASYAEHEGWNEEKMWQLIEEKIAGSMKVVLNKIKESGKSPREAATEVALQRLK